MQGYAKRRYLIHPPGLETPVIRMQIFDSRRSLFLLIEPIAGGPECYMNSRIFEIPGRSINRFQEGDVMAGIRVRALEHKEMSCELRFRFYVNK